MGCGQVHGTSEFFVTWLGRENHLYRRKAPVQESLNLESISYRKIMS